MSYEGHTLGSSPPTVRGTPWAAPLLDGLLTSASHSGEVAGSTQSPDSLKTATLMAFLNWVFFLEDSALSQVVRSLPNTLSFLNTLLLLGRGRCIWASEELMFSLHLTLHPMCITGCAVSSLYLPRQLTGLCLHLWPTECSLLKPMQTLSFLCG